MTPVMIIELIKEVVFMIFLLGAPILLVTLIVGVIISFIQAITQIQESTLTFVPKILAAMVTLILCAPWMIDVFVGRTSALFQRIPEMIQ